MRFFYRMLNLLLFLCVFVVIPVVVWAQEGEPTLPEGLPGWVYVAVPLAISSIARLVSVLFKSNNVVMKIMDFVAMAWYRARVDPKMQD